MAETDVPLGYLTAMRIVTAILTTGIVQPGASAEEVVDLYRRMLRKMRTREGMTELP